MRHTLSNNFKLKTCSQMPRWHGFNSTFYGDLNLTKFGVCGSTYAGWYGNYIGSYHIDHEFQAHGLDYITSRDVLIERYYQGFAQLYTVLLDPSVPITVKKCMWSNVEKSLPVELLDQMSHVFPTTYDEAMQSINEWSLSWADEVLTFDIHQMMHDRIESMMSGCCRGTTCSCAGEWELIFKVDDNSPEIRSINSLGSLINSDFWHFHELIALSIGSGIVVLKSPFQHTLQGGKGALEYEDRPFSTFLPSQRPDGVFVQAFCLPPDLHNYIVEELSC